MAVPYTFGTATAAIPLSQLDSNFATAITLGNTAVYLGNTTTSIGNLTLTNVTISSGEVTTGNVSVSGNVTLTGGTANGVAYLNVSKVLTTGSALVFDGTKLGIGTASPSNPLHIVSNTVSQLNVAASSGNTNAQINLEPTGTGIALIGPANSVAFAFRTNATERMYINTSGRVGVGILPTNTTKFQVVSDGNNIASFQDASAAGIKYVVATDGAGKVGHFATWEASGVDAYHAWYVTNSVGTQPQAMTLDASGNLGIGQTSIPSFTRLAVTGTAGAQTDAKQQITINAPTTTAGEGAGIRINAASGAKEAVGIVGVVNNATGNLGSMTFGVYNGGANIPEWMRISNAGIVTMSAYGAGAATFSAAGVISSVSDETWKIKDGVPVDPDSMLKKLEPGYWYYNNEKKETFGTDRQLGFYAQNVNAAIGPEAAPEPEEGKPWGYYDRSVLAITVMSLQKALATIELLNARITKLEGT